MKNMDIFKKTMPFVFLRLFFKLLINLIVVIFCIISIFLIAIFEGNPIGFLFVFILAAFGFGILIRANEYFDYMIKSAHIAVIAELANNNSIPDGKKIITYGKDKVKERFIATNVFIGLDKLVSGAISQIQRVVNKIGGFFDNIPGMKDIANILNLFINIFLGYVDEAVLAHIFLTNKEESAWKGAADGVVLYFQNWKVLMKNALIVVAVIILFYVGGTALTYGVISALVLGITNTTGYILLFFSVIIVLAILSIIKNSFIDSYITISVINKYVASCKTSTIQYDLYGKAKGWSSKFNKIVTNAEKDGASFVPVVNNQSIYNNGVQQNNFNQNDINIVNENINNVQQNNVRRFCCNCGALVTEGHAFCINCGNKL